MDERQLRDVLIDYAAGGVEYTDMAAAVGQAGASLRDYASSSARLIAEAELLMAEYGHGHRTEGDLKTALGLAAQRASLTIGDAHEGVRLETSTGATPTALRRFGLATSEGPTPGAHRRLAVELV